ncbi:MAG: MBL fold metallo-hydrolase [Candidatus Micrarchaeota archaeon]
MEKINIDDFKLIDKNYPNFLFLRIDERTCSTRYIVINEGKKLLIDSGDGQDELSFIPDVCILTHGHYDHTSGVKDNWPEVFVHEKEDSSLPYVKIPSNAKKISENKFKFGSLELKLIHIPGHTSGGLCIFEPKSKFLFSGDTKFADNGYGRTDLGGSDEQMQNSLEKLEKLPWEILCPGHGSIQYRDGKLI